MRVSTYGSYLTTSQSLGSAMERVQNLQTKIGTGKAVTAWDDDAPGKKPSIVSSAPMDRLRSSRLGSRCA